MGMLALATGIATMVAFLVCGIPFGVFFAERLSGVDVRRAGSGNIGMTNVARTSGAAAAALTFACDVGKGLLSMLIARLAISALCFAGEGGMLDLGSPFDWCLSWVYCGCVLGHVFSPYLGFQGGKGISVGFGAALGLWWPMGLGLLTVFLALTLPTGYVSLGSVAAALSLPVQALFWGASLWGLLPIVLVSIVVVWSHRANIGRLLSGTESRFRVRSDKGVRHE